MTDHKGNEETGELGITYSNKITRRTQKNWVEHLAKLLLTDIEGQKMIGTLTKGWKEQF